MTRGYQPGEITFVGAKSGVGKTSLLIQSAIANVREGEPVLLFSLEMTRQQILRRILCAVSGVPFPRVRDPRSATESEMQSLTRAAVEIEKWPLHIVDSAGISIEKITAAARLAMHQFGPPIALHLDEPFFAGIGFCSHLPDKSDTAILSNVVLENSYGKVH